jgi:CVNH domain
VLTAPIQVQTEASLHGCAGLHEGQNALPWRSCKNIKSPQSPSLVEVYHPLYTIFYLNTMSNVADKSHPKEDHRDPPKAVPKEPPKAAPKAVPKETPKAAPKETPKAAHPTTTATPARAGRPKRVTGKTRCHGVMPAPVHKVGRFAMTADGGSGTPSPSITSTTLQNTVLVTSGNDGQGNSGSAAVDLNTVLGNLNGGFTWGGTNFSTNARNISLSTAPGTGLMTLKADLQDQNGDYNTSTVQVAQDIGPFWDDPVALRTVLSVPHSVAHARNENADQADQQVLDQVDCPDQYLPVTDVQTLTTGQVQAIRNGTSNLVDNNGPAAGAAMSVMNAVTSVCAVANGMAQMKNQGMCTIL